MLLESCAAEFAQSLQMMTGQQLRVSAPVIASGVFGDGLWWTQTSPVAPGACLSVGADYHVWVELGTRALQGAGIEIVDEAEARSTWLEIVQRFIGDGARSASRTMGRTLDFGDGRESERAPEGGQVWSIRVTAPDGLEIDVQLVASDPLVRALKSAPERSNETAKQPVRSQLDVAPLPLSGAPPPSRTMDALLDVHLPVSISFGSSRMPLKDVVKLSAGSVVELNRHPEDPVDIIVNDHVIARGEVVVIDGNYAVRIQEIVSRQQRLSLRDGSIKR